MRALGSSRDLYLDNQQGQGDCKNRVAESLEAVESALGTMRFGGKGWLRLLRSIM
jgi:hypothetical protein